MRAKRTDANHKDIRTALRKLGWTVIDTSGIGKGFPDLICHRANILRLVEVKTAKGTLTKDQARVFAGVPVTILRTLEDVEHLV